MGGEGFPQEAPTQWALEMRKWTILLWVLLVALLIGKLVVLEVLSCLSILCVVAIGYFVPWGKPPMQQIWIFAWGALCVFNGVMDLIMAIMHYHQYQNGTYGRHRQYYGGYNSGEVQLTPMEKYRIKMAFYAIIIGFVLPLVEFIIAWLCYKLHKDHQASHDQEHGRSDPLGFGNSSTGNSYGSIQSQPGAGRATAPGNNFHAFQGQGQRLGGPRNDSN